MLRTRLDQLAVEKIARKTKYEHSDGRKAYDNGRQGPHV